MKTPFKVNDIVPWGLNLKAYQSFFRLTETDLKKRIISFGDGPASFNYEMTLNHCNVTSLDAIYRFNKEEISHQFLASRREMMKQIKKNTPHYNWTDIKNIQKLARISMKALNLFLNDFESGKSQGRYIYHELPHPTPFSTLEFDMGLSAHFLISHAQLGLSFHLDAITEMLRICKEIRLFPLLDLSGELSSVLYGIIEYFKSGYQVEILPVDYEFQRNGNRMLSIKQFPPFKYFKN
ncbi:SAM-dependent methyltransferase [Marinilabiliaceae bacterium JC017]|nr:SAM-dependent methyltransferase [Marinilabiliaceae bacterium JC017]